MHNDQTTQISMMHQRSLNHWAWYARIMLGASLILVALGALVLQREISQNEKTRFDTLVATSQATLQLRLNSYQALLNSVAFHFKTSADINRVQSSEYYKSLNGVVDFPGLVGLGWNEPVSANGDSLILGRLAGQGYKEPKIWPSVLVPRPRIVTMHVMPENVANLELIGFDIMSDPLRRSAIQDADTKRIATMTAPLKLFRDHDNHDANSVIIYLPVPSLTDPQIVRGYVSAILRGKDFFETIFPTGQSSAVELSVNDAQGGLSWYRSTSVGTGVHHAQQSMTAFGRVLLIDYHSSVRFDANRNQWLVPAFAVTGLIIGLALFFVARAQERGVQKNDEFLRQSTAARREAELSVEINRRLASATDPQASAQAVTNAGRELTGAAFGAFFTLGGPTGEVSAISVIGDSNPLFTGLDLPRITALFTATIDGADVVRLADVRGTMLPQVASYLAAAVRSKSGAMLGGLIYAHPQPGRFTADHERLLIGLAAQAAIIIGNTHLLNAEREALHTAARRADDLTAVNAELQQFIYVSSHDLQEPLRTITQYLDLLQRRHIAHLDEHARRYISYASESASRMYLLLNDLLTYARLGHDAEYQELNLKTVVDAVVQDLHVSITETHTRITVNPLPTIWCDRAKIYSLFQNLITNALKFRSAEDLLIVISSTLGSDGMWIISVADNGIGIRPEHHLAVFEVFHRLNNRESFPGTGIGLAICRKVVHRHGGTIWIEQTEGGGATFQFTLPIHGSGPYPIKANQ